MENQTVAKTRKQLNRGFFNIAEAKKVECKIVGNFGSKFSKAWEQDFITMEILTDNGVETVVLDGGLRGALKLSGIIAGDATAESLTVLKPDLFIEIEHAGKIEVENGMANNYNIYALN